MRNCQLYGEWYDKQGGLWKIWSAKEYYFNVDEKKEKLFSALQETSLSTKIACSYNYKKVDNAVYGWLFTKKSSNTHWWCVDERKSTFFCGKT